MNKPLPPLHPFFIGALFVLMGYRDLRPFVGWGELALCLAGTLGLIFVLFRLWKLFVKAIYKASVLTMVCVTFFFFFREMRDFSESILFKVPWLSELGRGRYLIPLMFLLLLGLVALIWRTRRDLSRLKMYLNVATGLMLMVTFVQILLYPVEKYPSDTVMGKAYSSPLTLPPEPPDIYYILSDGHTSAESLKTFWGYDESNFISFLEQNDFRIVKNAVGNYTLTYLCMTASLNMFYASRPRKNISEHAQVVEAYQAIRHAEVPTKLRAVGYEIVNLSSFPILDEPGFYGNSLLDVSTLMRLLLEKSAWHFYRVWNTKYLWKTNLGIFSALQKVSTTPSQKPRFVYAHIMMPHDPYLFDREGNPVIKGRGREKRKEDYLDQLIYTDRLLSNTVAEILKNSKTPPIIILQGDHGFRMLKGEASFKEAVTILNAYHLPGATENLVYEGITPVNSFRMIFNHYFATEYPYLPDKQYR